MAKNEKKSEKKSKVEKTLERIEEEKAYIAKLEQQKEEIQSKIDARKENISALKKELEVNRGEEFFGIMKQWKLSRSDLLKFANNKDAMQVFFELISEELKSGETAAKNAESELEAETEELEEAEEEDFSEDEKDTAESSGENSDNAEEENSSFTSYNYYN